MTKIRRKPLLFASHCASLSTTAVLLAAFAAHAETNPGVSQVQEVVVTAQKREQSLQDIPASISALGAEALAERGIANVADLRFMAPSFEAGSQLGVTAITIRAVGLNQGAPGVAVHTDGVYQVTPNLADLSQADLERIEILRGPQGTLYGRNANGGAVNFITKAPTEKLEGYVLASYAEYDDYKLQAVVNAPLNERVRSRLVLIYSAREDGFVDNILGGQNPDKGRSLAARLRIAADVTDDLKLNFAFQYAHASGPTIYNQLSSPPSASSIANNPFLVNAVTSFKPWTTTANTPSFSDRNYYSVAATADWSLGFGSLKSITAFQRFYDRRGYDGDTINLNLYPNQGLDVDETFTQELNYRLSRSNLDLVAGLYFMNNEKAKRDYFEFASGLFPLPPGTYLSLETPSYRTRAYAAFADANWKVAPKLTLGVGARLSRDEQRITYHNEAGFLVGNVRVPFLAICPLRTDELTFDSFTPRVTAEYQPGEGKMIYATYSKGFKSGGVNVTSCQDNYNPEKITAYETGLKTRLFDGRASLSVAAFYYDYTNLQLSQVVALSAEITNAAAAKVMGLEIEGAAALNEHISSTASLSLLDATYRDFHNIDTLDPGRGLQDLSGHRLSAAPKVSLNVGLNYRGDMTAWGRLSARIDVGVRSRIYFREFNQPLDAQPRYGVANLGLTWDSTDEAYSVRLFGNNLTDKAYIVRMGAADAFGGRYVTYGPPRQVGVELRARF